MTRRDLEAWQLLIGTTSELMKEMDVGNGRYQLSKSSAFIEGNFIDTVQREVLLTRFAHSEEERVAAILPLLAQYAQSPWSSQHHTPRRPRSSCSPSQGRGVNFLAGFARKRNRDLSAATSF